jgi:hypothetical protein
MHLSLDAPVGVMSAEQGARVRRRSWAGYTINMFNLSFRQGQAPRPLASIGRPTGYGWPRDRIQWRALAERFGRRASVKSGRELGVIKERLSDVMASICSRF